LQNLHPTDQPEPPIDASPSAIMQNHHHSPVEAVGEYKAPEEEETQFDGMADSSASPSAPVVAIAEPENKLLMEPEPASARMPHEKVLRGSGEEKISVHTDEKQAFMVPADSHSGQPQQVGAVVASSSARDYHPICQAAAHMEISYNISKLFHENSKFCDCVPRLCNDQGSCKVQVLRSVGKWSIGTKTECSILNCYLETIQNSHRFIYIENQFFIGSLAGDGTQNKIADALMERILRAYEQKQAFRVIVLIPLHPNGDFANAMKSQVVMHYEYMTINRCSTSMIQQLKKKAPGINVSDYISFYSLRNWGVINNKVVNDQIYVHDKLMIADDRVMIIGSANINDRSMLGFRDSEIAVRIEDTLHIESMLNGQPHTVGYLPFSTRLKLMQQHLGNPSDIGKFCCGDLPFSFIFF
jgi:hypothetical protein